MNDDIAIRAENVSKRYRISHLAKQATLRDAMHHVARAAWRRMRWNTGFNSEDFWALRDVNFEIKRGDVVGIIGRNGAGKSTLLKVLSRITEPTSGCVTLNGRVASLLEVGTGFHPELTGRDNIFLNGAILGMTKVEIRRKFDEIVAFAEVERFLDTPVKRYSSGMYVRLAFSVAAHLEPEILIVDEVLAVGDAAFQKKCLGKIREVAANSARTVIFVSHNMPVIQKICTKGILMENGRSTGCQPIQQAITAYMQADNGPSSREAMGILSRPVEVIGIQLADGTPGAPMSIVNGMPASLVLTVVVRERLVDARVTVAFGDSDGQRIFALTSYHDGHPITLEAGKNTIVIGFMPPFLYPDTFSLDLGFYSRTGETLLEAHGAGYITVEDSIEQAELPPRGGYGLVRVNSQWSSQPDSPRC
jgi:lipopolysaccharide transport system ATP-binding protein